MKAALQFKDIQLKAVIIQMIELGYQCTVSTIVAKRVFVQFFHETIDKSPILDPTLRDCEKLFDDIAVNLGVDNSANIDLDKLF